MMIYRDIITKIIDVLYKIFFFNEYAHALAYFLLFSLWSEQRHEKVRAAYVVGDRNIKSDLLYLI